MTKDAPNLRETMGRAVALHKAGRLKEAETLYRAVISRHPLEASVLNLLGLLCTQDGRLAEAIELMARALRIAPSDPNALFNFGRALQDAGRMSEALAAYDRALGVRRDWPEVLNNHGNVLQRLHRLGDALASYDLALKSRPDYAAALSNRGSVLRQLKRVEDAAETYGRLVARAPDSPHAAGWLLHTRLHSCDWTDYAELVSRTEDGVRRGKLMCEPWPFLSVSPSPGLQRRCAEAYMADRWPPSLEKRRMFGRRMHDRPRIAWIGDGFRNSVEAQTTVDLMELQDRGRFETFGVSLSADDGSPIRGRMIKAFEHFVDAYDKSDSEIANWLREREIDIAVAVAPEMGDWRSGIIADRIAPLQVNLGYPGALGTRLFDYTIADRHTVPDEGLAHFGEKVVRLEAPFLSYYAAGSRPDTPPSRATFGLPEGAFVFCGFNASYKIQPPVFDIWMGLLRDIEGSVLWLRADNAMAAKNLAREAERRGVAASRLIFASALPLDQHLARYAAADLFLDTFPYGAQTTACEALSAGLPVVTRTGEAMASRIAGALLATAGGAKLVTNSLEAYDALVRRLATTPALLADVRARLVRPSAPETFCRQLEAAFQVMVERHNQGLPPESFDISATA